MFFLINLIMEQLTHSVPHNNEITRYEQNSAMNSGALVDLSQPGTASFCTGDLLLGWDGRNKKNHRDANVQGCGELSKGHLPRLDI